MVLDKNGWGRRGGICYFFVWGGGGLGNCVKNGRFIVSLLFVAKGNGKIRGFFGKEEDFFDGEKKGLR